MTKPRWIGMTSLIAVALLGLVWFVAQAREPAYQGRTVGAWLEQYYQNTDNCLPPAEQDAKAREAAANAIRHIGTNAIPYFTRLAAAHDSTAKTMILDCLPPRARLMQFLGWERPFWRWKVSSVTDPHRAYCGFQLLGPEAKAAVPDLTEIVRGSHNPHARRMAAYCLSSIGPDAVGALPALIDNLADPVEFVRDASVKALVDIAFDHEQGRCRSECSRLMVPHLVSLLANPKADALRILRILCDIGPQAEAALPAIERFRSNQDREIRIAATRACERINSGLAEHP